MHIVRWSFWDCHRVYSDKATGPIMPTIMLEVCDKYQITPEILRSRQRRNGAWEARKEFCYLAHLAGRSYPQIGRFLGRDHTAALYAARAFEGGIRGQTQVAA